MINLGIASGLIITHLYSACPSFTFMTSLGYLDQLPMPKDLELRFFPKSLMVSAVHVQGTAWRQRRAGILSIEIDPVP